MSGLHQIASEAALEATREELYLTPRETHTELYRWLLELRINTRMYYLSQEMVVAELWPALRRNDALLDLLMRGAVSFYSRMEGHVTGARYRDYCGVLGHAIGELTARGRNPTQSVTDREFHDKIPPGTKLRELLIQEQWLTYLVTLERNAAQVVPASMLTVIDPVKETARA